jgi:hypothetical protein
MYAITGENKHTSKAVLQGLIFRTAEFIQAAWRASMLRIDAATVR